MRRRPEKSAHARIIDEGYQPVGLGTRKALGMKRVSDEKKQRKKKNPPTSTISQKKMRKNFPGCPYCNNSIAKDRMDFHLEFNCRAKAKLESVDTVKTS